MPETQKTSDNRFMVSKGLCQVQRKIQRLNTTFWDDSRKLKIPYTPTGFYDSQGCFPMDQTGCMPKPYLAFPPASLTKRALTALLMLPELDCEPRALLCSLSFSNVSPGLSTAFLEGNSATCYHLKCSYPLTR